MEGDDEHVIFLCLEATTLFCVVFLLVHDWGEVKWPANGSTYVESSDLSNIDTSMEL